MQGQIYGKTIEGCGQIPFVYSQAVEKPAWLKVTMAGEWTLLDTPAGAVRLNAAGQSASAYPAGTFLGGLNRPWIGLHTIDTVRRDAAVFQIPFESGLDTGGRVGFVRLRLSGGSIEYTIDMESDLIKQIRIMDSSDKEVGIISFSYPQSDAVDSDRFAVPRLPSGLGAVKTESLHWLSALAAGKLLSN
jgi:hypothetical protein